MKTIQEVATIFNVTSRTVMRWLKDGDVKFIKIGGTVRITDEEIERIKKGE